MNSRIGLESVALCRLFLIVHKRCNFYGLLLSKIRQIWPVSRQSQQIRSRLLSWWAGFPDGSQREWAALFVVQFAGHGCGLSEKRGLSCDSRSDSIHASFHPLASSFILMNLTWKRTLRTASSERFLAQIKGRDVAAVDLHYLANGSVAGTVILLADSGLGESDIGRILSALDDEFLPDVDLEHGNLSYTVVRGEVLGNWEASASQSDAG